MQPRHAVGFTLIELMVIVALSVTLLVLGVPSMASLINNNRLQAESSSLSTTIWNARFAAINRRQFVTVCGSNAAANFNACSNDWTQGYIAFVDLNGNLSVDSGEIVISSSPIVEKNIVINAASRIRFDSKGYALGTNGTLNICNSDSTQTIDVSPTGRISQIQVDSSTGCSQ